MMEKIPVRMLESNTWRIVVAAMITLLFTLAAFALNASPAFAAGTVTVNVTGQGSASGPGIDCNQSGGPDCSQFYPNVQECDPEFGCFFVPPDVELTAGSDTNGFVFDSWAGCDAVSLRACQMTVSTDRSVTALFRDAQAPSVSGLSPASGVQRGTINISAGASDNSGTVNRVEFRVRGVMIATDTTAPYSTSFNTTSVTDGAASIRATAFDAAGISSFSESNVIIDNTAPTLSITGGPDGQTFGPGLTQTWTFSASDAASGLASVQCSVVTTGSPASFGACSGGSGSHSVTGRPEGNYTFTVRARDNGGLETTQSRTFSIDATAPQTTITSGVADGSRTNQTSFTWGFSSSEAGSTFECRVYPAALTPPAFSNCSGAGSHTASGFSPGTYSFEVRATDAVGNLDSTPAKRTFTIDTTKPTVGSVTPRSLAKNVSARTNVTATFSKAMSAATLNRTTFKLVKKGTRAPVAARISYSGNKATLNPSRNLTAGATYTATVTTGARDVAGNPLAATKTWRFTIRR